MGSLRFIEVALDLEQAGLIWQPEIGDEVSNRETPEKVSILVDPHGMTPIELRDSFLWLPTTEQMVLQLEVRQAILFHAGLEMSEKHMFYKTVIQSSIGQIESRGNSLRHAIGAALRDFLLADTPHQLH